MTIEKKLLGTTPVSGAVDPEAVSFDGSNDYLSRSSDLTGNADGKTFTFSFWFWRGVDGSTDKLYVAGPGLIDFSIAASNVFGFAAYNASSSVVINVNMAAPPIKTWNHVLLSCDVTNTSNRYLYINDVLQSPTWATYTNSEINWTHTSHSIASNSGGSNLEGRLANFFLDHTYRDLSIESNRRLFIDADGKPASGQASLNPILYLPMTDAATAGSNSGTGGDFTVNGVLDTAGRGPNQNNCSASVFDGTNDYMKNTYSSYTDTKVITVSGTFNDNGGNRYFSLNPAGIYGDFIVYIGGGMVQVTATAPITGTEILNVYISSGVPAANANLHFAISFDLADYNKTRFYLDGVLQPITNATFTNVNLPLSAITETWVGAQNASRVASPAYKFNGSIGELYFDTVYTDLSTDNPFWDSDTNKPKPVRQVISETGTTPLIALPLRGDDAGNNLGTGGDFTVNSGPYTGARGGSEFWARSVRSSSGYLQRTGSNISTSASKEVTYVFSFKITSTIGHSSPHEIDSSNGTIISKQFLEGYKMDIEFTNGSGSNVYRILPNNTGGSSWTAGSWYTVLLSADLTNTANRHFILYKDGVEIQPQSANYSTYTNADIAWDQMYDLQMFRGNGNSLGSGEIFYGNYFLSSSYTDFSQEANRNLFIDQLGYLKDLSPAIDAGDIAEPIIYMKFDDTSALGTNSGTGGDFTVNGTVTAGADVDPNA
jgi:hypothetical protein